MNLLEFFNPQAFWWTLLSVPVIVFYILKVRLRRKPVTTLLFWDKLFNEKKHRSWWQQMRHLLSLLLQLMFLCLLVLALVDPLWSWQKKQQRRIILILDNSASMSAQESNNKTRLDLAKNTASTLIRTMRDRDEMAVLTAGGHPQVKVGLTSHPGTLDQAILAIPATHSPSNLPQALQAAQRLLIEQDISGEILMLTDGCHPPVPEQILQDKRISIYGVAKPQNNVAITRFQARRSLTDITGYQILMDVTNLGNEPCKLRVELNLGAEIVDVVPLDLQSGETKTSILDHTTPEGGLLHAELKLENDFKLDNHAYAVLPKCDPIPVTLISQGNLFLQGVLNSIPLVKLNTIEQVPDKFDSNSILVYDKVVPSTIPTGKLLLVDPQSSCSLFECGPAIEQALVAKVNPDSPLTRHLHLENVLFPGSRKITFKQPGEPLISDALDSPLYTVFNNAESQALCLTCSLEEGDLPLRIAFPVLMKNALEWFAGQAAQLQPAVTTGHIFPLELSGLNKAQIASTTPQTKNQTSEKITNTVLENIPDIQEKNVWELSSPTGIVTPISTKSNTVFLGPFNETGIWKVQPANQISTTTESNSPSNTGLNTSSQTIFSIACNLADKDESDLRPKTELQEFPISTFFFWSGRSLWFYLSLLGLLLLTIEWWLYQRRIVG